MPFLLVTPDGIEFPINYTGAHVTPAAAAGGAAPTTGPTATPTWKGFYIKEVTVTLPERLTSKIGGASKAPVTIKAQNLIIDRHQRWLSWWLGVLYGSI